MDTQDMTKIDKASDQNLTEEAYARSIGKAGRIPRQPHCIDSNDYIDHRIAMQAKFNPNLPWGRAGDRQRFWDDWHEQVYKPYEYAHLEWSKWKDAFLAWRKSESKKIKAGNNGAQLGPREFTLTYGTHFEDDEQAQRAMTSAIEKLTRYYKDEIIEFHAVGEFTKAGRAHVHGWYHLTDGKKITDKNFKRAYPPWNPKKKLGKGFEGGHHATIERVSDFHGYTEKHIQEAWLIKDISNDADDTAIPTPA